MAWTIEAKILPLAAGVSGHLYIEIFNDAGERVDQLNGIATCPKTGVTHAVGKRGDLLKAYSKEQFSLSASFNAHRDRHPHKGCVLFSGSEEDVRKALRAAHGKVSEINRENLPYKLLSQNSNSVFTCITEAMAKEVPLDKGQLKKLVKSKLVFPGVKNRLV